MSAETIYVGDIVRLSDEHGGLVGTLARINTKDDVQSAVVQLSGTATITVPPETLTYAGPSIPPEPADDGALVLIAGGVYRRGGKGWEPPSVGGPGLGALFFDEPSTWAWLIRRHGHAKPQRLRAFPIDAEVPA